MSALAIVKNPDSPALPARAVEITVPRGRLLAALKSVAPFMCQDATRFHLASVFIEVYSEKAPHQLVLVATDGHTLARARISCKLSRQWAGNMLLTSDDVKALIKLLACNKAEAKRDITLTFEGRKIALKIGTTAVEYKALDAPFPPYEQVIPTHGGNPAASIGVNPLYLARIGHAVDSFATCSFYSNGIKISYGGALDPIRFDFADSGEDFTGVVMPMRME